jgi:hypothetical protein
VRSVHAATRRKPCPYTDRNSSTPAVCRSRIGPAGMLEE